ncbi:glycosyltransferase family 2 protein [Tateyamaria omphalii]|uniref:glycosyltransferase n=1 Tax=Tateyamaria omphalii TaxID=299262 RepID=UPI001C99B823|nr:glycosyltransferase family 2 protein [Tateyamaria omphalii]MBY5933248.1 glycosyltransferase family 2 protein [Tateyamaria omphalii]
MNRPKEKKQPYFQFASVDSTPRGLSHSVPLWYGPALLGLFCVLSVVLLFTVNTVPILRQTFPSGDLIIGPFQGAHSISVRIFIVSFFISYSVFCHANPFKKVLMGLDLCLSFAVLCLALDLTTILLDLTIDHTLPLTAVAILSGILGFGVFSAKLLERGRMPASVPMTIDTTQNRQTLLRVAVISVYCTWLAIFVLNRDFGVVEALRSNSLLGGIGPGVFLFLPAFFAFLFLGGLVDQALFRIRTFAPDISVVIPAHNEMHIIEKTLRGVEAAAANYDGKVTVLFVDNASTDDTVAVVRRVSAELEHADVRVLHEPRPGKANALNLGLSAVETDFFVRIDADTIIQPRAFLRGMTYFFNDEVGALGGLPLSPGGGLFDRARQVEAIVKHGMYSVGLAAINGIVGVPGMFVIYRTELPRQLGGFAGGMNGEDTEMSLRIGELGYRLIVDPEVRFVSEVPRTYAHMREQRMRWFRSTYHVAARCRAVVFSSEVSFRGKIILPYMLLNSARRAMMIPLILFGFIEYFGEFKTLDVLQLQAVLAVILGAPMLISVLALIVNGYFVQLLYLPEYVVFRLLRSYFTLESNLSINLKMSSGSMYADVNAKAQTIKRRKGEPVRRSEA